MADDFSSRWQQLDWDDITLRINGKTARDVERALNADKLTRDDFMALISPAAAPYLEPLAQRAAADPSTLRQRRQLLCAAVPL